MPIFDRLIISAKCIQCGELIDHVYQFYYGSPWQRTFYLGDELIWDGNPKHWNGTPMSGLIALDAEMESCSICGYNYEYSVVYMDDGRFIGAGPNKNRFPTLEADYALPINRYVSPEEA